MITTDPLYPVAGETVTLTSDVGDASATIYSLQAKPADSALTLGQLVNRQGAAVQVFTPDVPGVYTFAANNYQELCPDPAAGIIKKFLSVTTEQIQVGRAMDLPIAALNGHSVTLRIEVVGSTVRDASLVNPATDLARNAILDTTVAAAVAALVGETIASLDDSLIENANSLRAKYEEHRVLTGLVGPVVHLTADFVNQVISKPARDVSTAVIMVQELATRIVGHTQPGILDQGWHGSAWDTRNVLMVAPRCVNVTQATVLCADLRERVYERHRAQTALPASHGTADNTNNLPEPKALTNAIVAYLDYIAAGDPTAPTGQSEGIGDAIAKFGFR